MVRGKETSMQTVNQSKTHVAGEAEQGCQKSPEGGAEPDKSLVVTSADQPVATTTSIQTSDTAWGAMRGSVLWEGDIISPLDDAWELSDDTDELFNCEQ